MCVARSGTKDELVTRLLDPEGHQRKKHRGLQHKDAYDEDDFWGEPANMVPWGTLSLTTPLMIFFLVFFLSQCYNRAPSRSRCQSLALCPRHTSRPLGW